MRFLRKGDMDQQQHNIPLRIYLITNPIEKLA